uniref:ATP synthase subunit 8 n=1 Tax=Laelaps chini TaxID=2902761 RepID=A0AAU6QEC0_9ACAR
MPQMYPSFWVFIYILNLIVLMCVLSKIYFFYLKI